MTDENFNKDNEIENNLEEEQEILDQKEQEPIGIIILKSLGLCGPLLWLIWNVAMKKWEALIVNIPLAIMAIVCLKMTWCDYLKKRNRNREGQRKQNRGSFLLFPLILMSIIIIFMMFVVVAILQVSIFEIDGWLFCVNSDLSMWIIIIISLFIFVTILYTILAKINKNSYWDIGIMNFVKRHWKGVSIVVIVALYVSVTGVTFVNEDMIIYHSWIHPTGITYSYSEVTEIKTGYKGGIGSSRGEFYYKACFDGRWISFNNTSPNEDIERYEDTYTEIEEFDEKLMQYHPKKISSHENEKYADLDQVYIDRFNRIIDNK